MISYDQIRPLIEKNIFISIDTKKKIAEQFSSFDEEKKEKLFQMFSSAHKDQGILLKKALELNPSLDISLREKLNIEKQNRLKNAERKNTLNEKEYIESLESFFNTIS